MTENRSRRSAIVAAFAALVFLCAAATAEASRRVALVVGNADYIDPGLSLKNPANDATALSETLRRMGFEVETLLNADRSNMQFALDQFVARAQGAEVAAFYFAGHGFQMNAENHFLGVDFDAPDALGAARSSIQLTDIRQRLSAANPQLGLIVLDACRDMPFDRPVLGASSGLARPTGGVGIMIAYATDPGNVAYDGGGENSIFTTSLLRHIETPGLDVRLMFGRVRQEVVMTTEGGQVPWVEEAVIGEHSLSRSPPLGPRIASPEAADIAAWRQASEGATPDAYLRYLSAFPEGMFRDVARTRISPVPASATTGSIDSIVASASPVQLAASLSALGFLPERAGTPGFGALRSALDAYARTTRQGDTFGVQEVRWDAARTLAVLGAVISRQIRTDMAALSASERALAETQQVFSELEALVAQRYPAGSPEADQILSQSRGDVGRTRDARDRILQRLDESRTYYDDLLNRASTHFSDVIDSATVGFTADTRGLGAMTSRLGPDLQRFVRHVDGNRAETTKGSYRWLADFLPR